jgi:hypothetical protein
MSVETERVQRVGYVLWGVVLASVLLGGVAVASGALAAGEAGPATPSADTGGVDDATDRAGRAAESRWGVPVDVDVDADADAPSFDFAVDLPGVGVSGENVGNPDDPQSVGIDSDAIDEGVADGANVGLCAVGLDEPNPSGVTLEVDESGSATASLDPDPDRADDPRRESAQSVVDRCTGDG